MNQAFMVHEPRELIPVETLYEQIMDTSGIEGVTYSGGEPFEQAEGLFFLSGLLKESGTSIVCYTGYRYPELAESGDPYILGLLSQIDILIDGRYEESLSEPLLWRGSRNQSVLFLSDRYKEYRHQASDEILQMEVEVRSEGLTFIGNMDNEIVSVIAKLLKKDYGIVLDPTGDEGSNLIAQTQID